MIQPVFLICKQIPVRPCQVKFNLIKLSLEQISDLKSKNLFNISIQDIYKYIFQGSTNLTSKTYVYAVTVQS